MENYKESVHCENQKQWDFVLSKFNPRNLESKDFEDGIDACISIIDNEHDYHTGAFAPKCYDLGKGYTVLSFKQWCIKYGHENPFKDKADAPINNDYNYINPAHYKQGGKETIEKMIDIWGANKVATYCEINAFKYMERLGAKPDQPIERDLAKATWYLNKAKELKDGTSNLQNQ